MGRDRVATMGSPADRARRSSPLRRAAEVLSRQVRVVLEDARLPSAARIARRRDRQGILEVDAGIAAVVAANMSWLRRAQDRSASRDGGVSHSFSLVSAWATSYPETTGYIVPTFLQYAALVGEHDLVERAERMLDWLVSIQFPEGGFQGGRVDSVPRVPVTFNTGQILLGLAAGAGHHARYRRAMCQAATWLRDTQDPDGCWRRHPSPFAHPGEKAYDTHVAWALLEADRVSPGEGYAEAALRNITWALGKQQQNGWFADCCLTDPERPLTHTLGYVLRGLVEGYLYSRDRNLLAAARCTADGLTTAVGTDGHLAGRLSADWTPAVRWVCLTGAVQIAHSLLLLYREAGDRRYLEIGRALNRYVRRTVSLTGDPDVRGGVRGSYPIHESYGRFQYLNWAAKFCVDANLLEQSLRPV